MSLWYALGSAVLISLIAVLVVIPFLLKKKLPKSALLFMLSVSVGVLLSTVFIDFLPEAVAHGYTLGIVIYILIGFLVMFVVESVLHKHHEQEHKDHLGHEHGYTVGPIVLLGEAVHNFIDGLVIAGSYAVNVTLGIAATISIMFHEIPQELADFGVLLYAGYSKKRALYYNFLTAVMAIIGVLVGWYLVNSISWFKEFIIPFAIGNFLYIAATNLVPQLHKHCTMKETLLNLLGIVLGVGVIVLITLYGPAHGH